MSDIKSISSSLVRLQKKIVQKIGRGDLSIQEDLEKIKTDSVQVRIILSLDQAYGRKGSQLDRKIQSARLRSALGSLQKIGVVWLDKKGKRWKLTQKGVIIQTILSAK